MAKKLPGSEPKTPRRLSVAWSPFAPQLADCLRSLDDNQYLILFLKRGNRFVQLAAQGAFGMRAETTGNDYLAGSERPGASQLAAFGAAGWRGPTGSPAESTFERDPDGSSNFFGGTDAGRFARAVRGHWGTVTCQTCCSKKGERYTVAIAEP